MTTGSNSKSAIVNLAQGSYGFFNFGDFYFHNYEEVKVIHLKFLPFYNQHMQKNEKTKKNQLKKKYGDQSQETFKPKLNPNSMKMANNQFEAIQKELQKNHISLDHSELLIKKGMIYKERKDKRLQDKQENMT
jgi:hypothetical protein